ncbi:MAG: succinylglutamate desuccinylase/aspartoacylase family protein [Acidobacteriota bacterium]|nr:succinylglutamate desuccinylase/aspartoacylase family protein [Acidobacteriota bacterium]
MTYRDTRDHAVKLVHKLDLDYCPRGHISRMRLVLYHDGLGEPGCIPVLAARGEKPGPVFGITAAIHGNEVNGIPVIHKLLNNIDLSKLRGTLVCIPVVNVPGMLMGTRAFNDATDLNTIIPGREDGRDGEVFINRFCKMVVEQFDYLVDLHTASFGRVNSLYVRADMTDEVTAVMARLQRPEIILHNTPSDGTLRGYAMELGIPSITVEVGNPHRFHPEYIRRALAGLRAVLSEVKMIPKRQRAPGPTPILCKRSYWLYADHGGLLEVFPKVTELVEKNQEIARLLDIYGDVTRVYRAPETGVVIGKSVHPVGQTGARILHLGILDE